MNPDPKNLELYRNTPDGSEYYVFMACVLMVQDEYTYADVLVNEVNGYFERRKFKTDMLKDKITLRMENFFTITVPVEPQSPDEFVYADVPEESLLTMTARFNRGGIYTDAANEFLSRDSMLR